MTQTAELTTLETVMDKTADLIAGVRPDQLAAPTPCTEWDVERLTKHLVGWVDNFAARAEGSEPADEPDAIALGDDPAGHFRAAAGRLISGLSVAGELPEKAPQPAILIAEYVTHGTDLATATGQPSPFTDAEAEPGLAALRGMLKPEYRGQGFEKEVEVPDDADTITKLRAFSGRAV